MAAAAGIVVAQDYAGSDNTDRSIKERLGVLQEVRALPSLPRLLANSRLRPWRDVTTCTAMWITIDERIPSHPAVAVADTLSQ